MSSLDRESKRPRYQGSSPPSPPPTLPPPPAFSLPNTSAPPARLPGISTTAPYLGSPLQFNNSPLPNNNNGNNNGHSHSHSHGYNQPPPPSFIFPSHHQPNPSLGHQQPPSVQNQFQYHVASPPNGPSTHRSPAVRRNDNHHEDDESKMVEEIAMSLKSFSENLSSYHSQKQQQQHVAQQQQHITQPPVIYKASTTDGKCNKCNGPLHYDQKNVLFNGRLYHPQCFVCETCNEPLENTYLQADGKPYCERDYAKIMDVKSIDLPLNLNFYLTSQPAKFQIANYNIHPPPSLAVEAPLPNNHTVYIYLVESISKTVVNGGFQSGDVRVLRAGQTTIYFTGLKLNKMGPIKTELHFRNSRQLNSDFCVQFKIGSRSVFSTPFKLVSSCSQLPQEIRDNVRPTKKSPLVTGGVDSPVGNSSPDVHSPHSGNNSTTSSPHSSFVTSSSSSGHNSTMSGSGSFSLSNSNNINNGSNSNVNSHFSSILNPSSHDGQNENRNESGLNVLASSSGIKRELESSSNSAILRLGSFSSSNAPSSPTSNGDEARTLRIELESAIQRGDPELAARAASALAALYKRGG